METAHTCLARGCGLIVAPRLLMCRRHWRMVPPELQRAVWHHYRPGQERDKRPSALYLESAQRAIEAVAHREAQRLEKSRRAARQQSLLPKPSVFPRTTHGPGRG
jgi:hypothetical protein